VNRFLVTGGAGFIGSHLVERCISENVETVILDDLSTGSMENIKAHLHDKRVKFVEGSILDESLIRSLIQNTDAVIHLAAAVGVRLVIDRPIHTIETNIHGTSNILAAAKSCNCPVLIASSSEVYGISEQIPFKEDDFVMLGPTRKSRWSYACTKALDEWMALAYATEHGLPVVICRLFNTVGPRQTGRYGMVLPTFISQALSGKPITVFGDGNQTRCFLHVKDTVDAIFRIMHEPAALGLVFNIGSQEEITINQLARMVTDISGIHADIDHIPYEKAYGEGFEDLRRRVPDISKLQRIIGFKPQFNTREIVKDILNYQHELVESAKLTFQTR